MLVLLKNLIIYVTSLCTDLSRVARLSLPIANQISKDKVRTKNDLCSFLEENIIIFYTYSLLLYF